MIWRSHWSWKKDEEKKAGQGELGPRWTWAGGCLAWVSTRKLGLGIPWGKAAALSCCFEAIGVLFGGRGGFHLAIACVSNSIVQVSPEEG